MQRAGGAAMTDPITPPPELVAEWLKQFYGPATRLGTLAPGEASLHVATAAAQWGADQELEACCEWTQSYAECGDALRLARRPKPPSLRKQAYDALDTYIYGEPDPKDKERAYNTIRQALEALPND